MVFLAPAPGLSIPMPKFEKKTITLQTTLNQVEIAQCESLGKHRHLQNPIKDADIRKLI